MMENVYLLAVLQSKFILEQLKSRIFFSRYQVEEIGFANWKDRYGLIVKFAEKVEVATSHFKIQPMTMFARIGGIIGVGQVILWHYMAPLGQPSLSFQKKICQELPKVFFNCK